MPSLTRTESSTKSTKSSRSLDSTTSTKSSRSTDNTKNLKSPKTMEPTRTSKSPKTTESAKTSRSSGSPKSSRGTETSKSPRASENPKCTDSAKKSRSADGIKSSKVTEGSRNTDHTKTARVSESLKSSRSTDTAKTPKASESLKSSKKADSSKSARGPESVKSSKTSSTSKTASTRDSRSTRCTDSYESTTSSNPTTVSGSPRPSQVRTSKPSSTSAKSQDQRTQQHQQQEQPRQQPQQTPVSEQASHRYFEDLSPGTCLRPRSSTETYASTNPSQEHLVDEEDELDSQRSGSRDEIPPLPTYRHEVVEPNVRPTTPNEFARLFPSMNRLSIRHDEFTSDGNMNLRVDTAVHSGRRRGAAQLFHLRMYDLARREFSLRRYCRDSGREVCNTKRKYTPAAGPSLSSKNNGAATASDSSCTSNALGATGQRQEPTRPSLQRAMTSAIKTLSSRPQSKRTQSSPNSGNNGANGKRPASSGSSSSSDREPAAWGPSAKKGAAAPSVTPAIPTNIIKLEFSNYARVDIERCGKSSSDSKRYDFQWWGHKYSWKRTIDKHTGAVSFHLMRDGGVHKKKGDPRNSSVTPAIAHIVPETRSPIQVADDEEAGGWVPPCHMWINDESVLDAMTDVADVIVATGLIALVDDCIKERWQTPKIHRFPVPLTSRTVDLEYVGPKAFMRQVFGRKNSNTTASSPKPSWPSRTDAYGKDYDDGYGYAVYEHHYDSGYKHVVSAH